MFKFFIENDSISPGDSCVNQLLSITHDIYKPFDCGYEVRGVFLDISKAFDKVWHDGIIFKFGQNSISGKLHKLLHDFLLNRKQRVVLNGQVFLWANVKTGVSEGSILGPLLFLTYINDLPKGLSLNAKLFADDTSLFSVIHDSSTTRNELNDNIHQYPSYIDERRTFTTNLNRINPQIYQTSLQLLTNMLLFGNPSYSDKNNTHILNGTTDYIQLTKRFDEPLF